MTPDYAARKILMAAHLYYGHDVSIISDSKYDELSVYVADNWSEVNRIRQWQLGKPEEVKASGYLFKFTSATVFASSELAKIKIGEHTCSEYGCFSNHEISDNFGRYITT